VLRVAPVHALFDEVQRQTDDRDVARAEAVFARLESEGWPRGDRQQAAVRGRVERAQASKRAAEEWLQADFSATPLPSAADLFGGLASRVRSAQAAPSLVFDPAWSDYDSPENVEDQTDLLDAAYKSYVEEHARSSVVEIWTREADGSRPAPHQIADSFLLAVAGLGPKTSARPPWLERLYNLVTQAPRSPRAVSLFRTVRQESRRPSAWFERVNARSMKKGDVVVLPTFLSTANLTFSASWLQHGFGSVASEFDEEPAQPECCIVHIVVPKGVPMLPLGNFDSNKHQHENEVLLAPGIELVYLGEDLAPVDDDVSIESYVARLRDPS
jgi:hypothetical protein